MAKTTSRATPLHSSRKNGASHSNGLTDPTSVKPNGKVPHGVEDDFDDKADPHHPGDSEVSTAADHSTGSSDGSTDDPVRMYLMQMGGIPMLTRPGGRLPAPGISVTRRNLWGSAAKNIFKILDLLYF